MPGARAAITEKDLQTSLIVRVLTRIFELADTRADDLSELMRKNWGIDKSLKDLPTKPRWMINATCYETGKNWRFEPFRMGDYVFGYTNDTDVPLSDAMAASAGFPGLIGALPLETSQRQWFRYKESEAETLGMDSAASNAVVTVPVQPAYSIVHLWDGGLYDNHGLEGLHKFSSGWKEGIDFLIVSDAAGRSKPQAYRKGIKAMQRIVTGIMMDQIRSLRARSILERIINHDDKGAFLQIGNNCEFVLKAAGKADEVDEKCPGCLSEAKAVKAANMGTNIAKMDDPTFERLFRHGFEVADYTLYAYNHPEFDYIGYKIS